MWLDKLSGTADRANQPTRQPNLRMRMAYVRTTCTFLAPLLSLPRLASRPASSLASSPWRLLVTAGALGLASALLPGCGGALCSTKVFQATRQLAEAEALGAEEFAPYQYTVAREHLLKAREEAAEADYGDAAHLADESRRASEEAIQLTRAARSQSPKLKDARRSGKPVSPSLAPGATP